MLPAYAGMILVKLCHRAARVGAPRIRGDDPVEFTTTELEGTCSPHTRG